MFTYIIYNKMNYKESGKFNGEFLVLDIDSKSKFLEAKKDMIYNKEYNLYLFDYVRSILFSNEFNELENMGVSHPEDILNSKGGDMYWLTRHGYDLKCYVVTFIFIPYKDKDILKSKFGGKWCSRAKSWYFVGDKHKEIHDYCKENNKNWEFEKNDFTDLWNSMNNNKTFNELNRKQQIEHISVSRPKISEAKHVLIDDENITDLSSNEVGGFVLLENIDGNSKLAEYYCANIKEKTFKCNKKLWYSKSGGFGMNYRYCSSCYAKWNALEKEKQINKYYSTSKPKPETKPKSKYENINFDSDSD